MAARSRRQSGRRAPIVCAAVGAALLVFTDVASAQQAYAIKDARIVTVSGPVIEKGTVVIRDGRIADVGAAVTVPAEATVIDGRGLTVYPGLFDAFTSVGLTEIPGLWESDDFSDIGDFTPQLMTFDAFHSASAFVAIARSVGILHVVSSPSSGIVAGQGAVMALGGWTADEMVVAKHGPMFVDFPKLLNYDAPAYTRRRHPYAEVKDYATKMRELTEFFAAARKYMDARDQAGAEAPAPTAEEAPYEAMIPVLKGRQPVFIEVQSEQDIRKAVGFAREQKLNYVLVGAEDAPLLADFLKEQDARVIVGPPGDMPIRPDDPVDTVCRAAAVLHEHGVGIAFGTVSGTANDLSLRHQVGMAVACGLPRDVALRSVTLTPAEFVGVAGEVGSIETGKRADLVLTDGDIFEYGTHIIQTFVNGKQAGVESRYTDLYEKYKDRK